MKKEELLNKVDSRIIKGIAHRGLHNEIYTENANTDYNSDEDNWYYNNSDNNFDDNYYNDEDDNYDESFSQSLKDALHELIFGY